MQAPIIRRETSNLGSNSLELPRTTVWNYLYIPITLCNYYQEHMKHISMLQYVT